MRCLLALLCVLDLQAADHWIEVQSGPFRVVSGGGPTPVRVRLGQLEQFRHAFSVITGVKEPQLVWPLDLVLAKTASPSLNLSRKSRFASIPESGPLPQDFLKNLTLLFIDDNLHRLPENIEQSLTTLFSTFQSEGTHITIGGARDGGLLQMLVTDPTTLGEVHVFLYNLQQGADLNTASRGAYQQPYAAIQARFDKYVQAGVFSTSQISGAAVNPIRDFRADPLDADEVSLAMADLALASGSPDAQTAYQALHGMKEAAAGLGLAELAEGKKDQARRSLDEAASAGSKSARVYFELGLLETDVSKKHGYLVRAAELNPRWGEPYYQMALAAKNPANQAEALKKAVALDPRNVVWWRKLAESATTAGDFQQAAKAWTGASLAAHSDDERNQLLKARADMELQRSDAIDAEQKRRSEEEAKELERVKQQTLAEIHAAESKANQELSENGSTPVLNPVPYSSLDAEGPRVEGTLVNLDCRPKLALLIVQGADQKVSKFVVGDPTHLAMYGSESTLDCGPQKSPRKIIVEYKPKEDRRLGTIGEVRTVQFP